MTLSLNGLRVVSVRWIAPWSGAWQADVDFDLAEVPVMPSGKAAIVVGTSGLLNGAIDERDAGKFGTKARARVVGGNGGWEKIVGARAYHNDAGVLSSAVITTTAAEVGEVVVDTAPTLLGASDFIRTAGPASRVLAGLPWYVNTQGVTVIGPRPPIPTSPTSVEVLSWEPREQRAEVACDELLLPGSILVDPTRFGTVIVRDVEQTFDDKGARAIAWCVSSTPSKVAAGNRLIAALGAIARETTGSPLLRSYRYRVLKDIVGRYQLQAVKKTLGVPETIGPLSAWTGAAGVSAKLKPGAIVLVSFVEGDPGQPLLLGYQEDDTPLEVKIDATTKVGVGAGTSPVAKAPELATWAAAVVTACAAHVPPITIPPLPASFASPKLFTE